MISVLRTLAVVFPLLAWPHAALAQSVYCGALPGCGEGGWVDFSMRLLTALAAVLPDYAIALGVLFVSVGALYMLLNMGDEQRIETGKKTIIWSLVAIAIALFAGEFMQYVAGEQYRDPVAGTDDPLIEILSAAWRIVRTFFTIALTVAILFNAFRMILSRGADEEFAKAKNGFFWAAIGAILINVTEPLISALIGIFTS